MKLLCIFFDIKKSLSISNCFLKCSTISNGTLQLKIDETSLTLFSKNNVPDYIINFNKIKFAPDSCSELNAQFNDDFSVYTISFRVSIIFNTLVSSDVFGDIKICGNDMDKLNIAYCSNCEAKLIDLERFKRIIKEPSEESLDILESIWCPCRHHSSANDSHSNCNSNYTKDTDHDYFNDKLIKCSTNRVNNNLNEKYNDLTCNDSVINTNNILKAIQNMSDNISSPESINCSNKINFEHCSFSGNVDNNMMNKFHNCFEKLQLSENSMEVNYSCVKDVCDDVSGKLTCRRCSYYLGQILNTEKELNAIFSCSQLYFNIPNTNNIRLKDLTQILKNKYLREDSSRFVLESLDEHNKKSQYILLWLMEIDSTHYLFHQNLENLQKIKTDLISKNVINLKARSMVKLLYCPCYLNEQNKILTRSWLRDFSVECLFMNFNSIFSLLRNLHKSTQSLPEHLRKINEFYVGYF